MTAGLLWVLLVRADLSRAKEMFDHASWPLLAAAATTMFVTSPFSAFRRHVVLAAETASSGPWTLAKIVLVELFFNQVPPSGGDAVRA